MFKAQVGWPGRHLTQQTDVAKDLFLILILSSLFFLFISLLQHIPNAVRPSVRPSFQNQDPAKILALSHPSSHPSPVIQPGIR
jgi:hypothetical protein